MLRVLRERLRQGHRTMSFPENPLSPPPRFRGLPSLEHERCGKGCKECIVSCPQGAISGEAGLLAIDLGRCVFCGRCVRPCPSGAISLGNDFRVAARTAEGLIVRGRGIPAPEPLEAARRSLYRRSLKLRQVSAGGCNACEAEVNVLGTVAFDLGRFGIQVVASPRHADGILVTGPVSTNMRQALLQTYDDAIPAPRLVIACGSCAISGGPFRDSPYVCNGVDSMVAADLYVPGCPPHPLTLLYGLLALVGRAY